MRIRIPPLLLLACLAAPCPALAQQLRSLEVRFDNDVLALRGTGAPPDHDYTHGLELSAEFLDLPGPLRRWLAVEPDAVADARRATSRISVGQRIYTPRQDGTEPVPGERPYAGWLFGSADVRFARSRTEHEIGLELGITGPAALGEPVQNGFHRLVGSTRQEGWDHQLDTEPAGLVRYGIAWPRSVAAASVRPRLEAGIGSLWSGAAGGLDVRLSALQAARGLFGQAGLRQEWVVRNLFLDGTSVGGSVRAVKIPWVTEASVGLGYGFAQWDVAYRFVLRSREYEAQSGPHGYGSVAVKWRRSP